MALSGVTLPYLSGSYGHDLAPNQLSGKGPGYVDPMLIYGQLLQAREFGYRAIRIWLCEGAEGILLSHGAIGGLHPVLIESIAIVQEGARLAGLKVYWTLLDAHSCERTDDPVTRAILIDLSYASRFADLVAVPLSRYLDPELTLAIEIVNEPEALMISGAPSSETDSYWQRCGSAIRMIGEAIRSEQPEMLLSAGSDQETLLSLWGSNPRLDAVDVHCKGNRLLPSRIRVMSELKINSSEAASMPLIGGCLAGAATDNDRSDYSAIFRWRLGE